MKKIYAFLSLICFLAVANTGFAQIPYDGPSVCDDALPILHGNTYATTLDGSCGTSNWYAFTAPADGQLTVSNCSWPNESDRRIYSGDCSALTLELSTSWTTCTTGPYTMTEGEVIYLEVIDSWDCQSQWDVNFVNPACLAPTGLSGTATSYDEIDVSWSAGGGESDWILTYGPSGFDPTTSGTTVLVSGTPSATISGLSQLSCYDFYVQADCGGGEFSIPSSVPVTICTPALCPAPTFTNVAAITTEDATLVWSAGASEVIWDVEWEEAGFVLGSGVFVDNTPFTNEPLTGLLTADTDYDFYVRAVCDVNLSDGVDTVSLWVGPTDWTTDPNCFPPTSLGATPSAFSASLSWIANNGETEWAIQYGSPGFVLGSGTTVAFVPSNPFNLTGLTPETDYSYYVRAHCGSTSDSLSGWAGPYNFTTQTYCDAPTGIGTSGITYTEATIDWDAGTGTDWTIEYGPSGFTPGSGTMTTSSVFPTNTLTGLTEGTTYCYYIQSNCGSTADSSSAWVGPNCFTTQALCPEPGSLDAINITETAANLIFVPGGAESSWNLEWGVPGFNVDAGEEFGSVDGTTSNPHYATGLMNSTPYWYYVQAVCGVDTMSNWVGPYLFGTDIVNDQPCDAIKITVDSPQRQFHNFLATTDGGETAIAPATSGDCFGSTEWCAGDGINQSVWFYFTAPTSGKVSVSTFDTSGFVTDSYTEIAVYSIGDCSVYPSFTLQGANTLADDAFEPPYGSELELCGLTPGQNYYVLVNPISYIQNDIIFGLEVNAIDDVEAGTALNPSICAESTVDLFTTIAGYSVTDGQWYNPTPVAGNELPSLVSFPAGVGSYDLYYIVDNGCDMDTVMTTVSTVAAPTAGGDGSYVGCNTFDIVLSDHLSGASDGGGTWIDNDGTDALFGGLFVPYGLAPGVYTFTYTVSNASCPTDSATVTVTLTECLGLDEETAGTLSVFPNPVVDVLTIQDLNIKGSATIELIDVQGKLINSNVVTNVYGNYELDMTELESGVYFVKIVTDNATQKVRVVKK